MKELNKYAIFTRHYSSLKETSLDRRDEAHMTYMTDSPLTVVDFDAVKNEYISGLNLCEVPKSNDALFEDNGKFVFVEFKNGNMDRREQFSVRKKIYDSVLMFTDITPFKISDMRENVNYILVYNDEANKTNTQDQTLVEKNKTTVRPSSSFDSFAKAIGQLAGEEYVCFGLKIFKNYCFKEVHTFTQDEFEMYLDNLYA